MNTKYKEYEAQDGEVWYKAEDEDQFVLCIHDTWIYLSAQDLQQMQAILDKQLAYSNNANV